MRINFKKYPEIVYMDTIRTIPADEVKDYWEDVMHDECEDSPALPAEDSAEWYAIIERINQDEYDCLADNLPYANMGVCLVHGYTGTWRGDMEGGKVMRITSIHDLLACVGNCDTVKVYVDKEGLHVDGYHHDGFNHYTIHPLTKKGEAYWERHPDNSREIHHHLLRTAGYTRKVRDYLF